MVDATQPTLTAHEAHVLRCILDEGAETTKGTWVAREMLAMKVWPGRPSRYSSNGGPTGLARALGPTLARLQKKELIRIESHPPLVVQARFRARPALEHFDAAGR